jgi:hypothetical protein
MEVHMSRKQDSISYRVVEQEDGGLAVHVLTRERTKVVPGFPTSDQAQQWIDRELSKRPNH